MVGDQVTKRRVTLPIAVAVILATTCTAGPDPDADPAEVMGSALKPIVFTGPGGGITVPYTRPDMKRFDWRHTFGEIEVMNDTSNLVELLGVEPVDLTEGIEFTGRTAVMTRGENGSSFAYMCGGLPVPDGWKTYPLQGFRLEPGADIILLLEVRNPLEMLGGFDGVQVRYLTNGQTQTQLVDFFAMFGEATTNQSCAERRRPPRL